MPNEIAYALITPGSLEKSRAGMILARLMGRTGLELVAARMFAPGAELAASYAEEVRASSKEPHENQAADRIHRYVTERLAPDSRTGRGRRALMLVFQGENAVDKIHRAVGPLRSEARPAETIRDSFAEAPTDDRPATPPDPVVLMAAHRDEAARHLSLWARYSEDDGGIVSGVDGSSASGDFQRTLVLIKPENFRFPSARPGHILDFFAGTGLSIAAMKVAHISVAEAEAFYGPVLEILRTRLKGVVAGQAKEALETELGFPIPAQTEEQLGELLGPLYGENQFENIIRFMTGRAPQECDEALKHQPGTAKCLALIYEGENAVQKIRDVLGPTNPAKAPPGTIRAEFGTNIMVNAAHASDSPENAEREMKIIQVGDNAFRRVVEAGS